MSRINKRGLSDIVATVLIIFLVISSVTLIAAAVLPIVRLAPERISCAEIQIDLPITFEGACTDSKYTNDGGFLDVRFRVERVLASNIKIDRIDFTLASDTSEDQLEYYCGEDCTSAGVLDIGESKNYFLDTQGRRWDRAIVEVNGCVIGVERIMNSC